MIAIHQEVQGKALAELAFDEAAALCFKEASIELSQREWKSVWGQAQQRAAELPKSLKPLKHSR